MPVFTYQVRDKRTGKVTKGKLTADSASLIKQRLTATGQVVLQIRPQSKLASFGSMSLGGKKVKKKDIAIFARQFATMIEAGLSITKALSILAAQTESKALQQVINQLSIDVESGNSLSEAVSRHPKVFPTIFLSMVRAGEAGGVLDLVLSRLADHFESELSLIGKVKAAITYPVAMAVLVVGIAIAMLIFIVPVFEKMFNDSGATLPGITRAMLVLSRGLMSWTGPAFFVVLVILFWLFMKWKKTIGKPVWDAFILRVPVIGPIVKKMVLARFTRTFATLVAAGVPMLTSLEIVADTAGNETIRKVVLESRTAVKEGNSLAQPYADSKVFPAMLSQMITVGEETGALDTMLEKVADFYDDEVSSAVNVLTSTLEPLMMGGLGGVVGTMVVGLYLPMFQMVTVIK